MKGRDSSLVHSEEAFPCLEPGGESLTGADAEVPQSHITCGARFFTWHRHSVFIKLIPNLSALPDTNQVV